MQSNEAVFARVHALAVSAMASAAARSAPPIGVGLTLPELQRLQGWPARCLVSLDRLLSHLLAEGEAPAWLRSPGSAAPAAARISATSLPARAARARTVAVRKTIARKAIVNRSSAR